MKFNGLSIKGKKHNFNQDSFCLRNVMGNKVLIVSDGLGSKKYSHIGSKLLCKSVMEVIYEEIDLRQLSLEALINKIYSKWIKRLEKRGLYYRDCLATLLFTIIYDDEVLCFRTGDGIISIISDYDHRIFLEDKNDSFSNLTIPFTLSINRESIDFELVKYNKFLNILCLTDGIDIFPYEEKVFKQFSQDIYEEYKEYNDIKTNKLMSKWIKKWPSNDDKTLVYYLKEKC